MSMIYVPAKGSRITKEQAQRYGDHLEVLLEENNGSITPRVVLDSARDPSSPTHDFFEWNDAVAAEHWRTNQASYMMRSIHVVVKRNGTEEQQRYLYNVNSVPFGDTASSVYVSIRDVQRHPDLSDQVIHQALRYLDWWQGKYQIYNEFDKIIFAIKETKKEIESN
jgi:hypothetical protein